MGSSGLSDSLTKTQTNPDSNIPRTPTKKSIIFHPYVDRKMSVAAMLMNDAVIAPSAADAVTVLRNKLS
jgi:hypothetical protein